VVVTDTDELASRGIEAEIVISMKPDVSALSHVPDAIIVANQLAGDFRRVVIRTVIADQNLEI
jgi:hypothetical protein